jgi:hypothetical protein
LRKPWLIGSNRQVHWKLQHQRFHVGLQNPVKVLEEILQRENNILLEKISPLFVTLYWTDPCQYVQTSNMMMLKFPLLMCCIHSIHNNDANIPTFCYI